MSTERDYVLENRRMWDEDAHEWVESGERLWAGEPEWGIWGIPETEVGMLPTDMTGLRAIELGCGTGYVSAWMTRRGASVVAIDNSENQLSTARRLAQVHGTEIEWVHGNAEEVPWPDSSFDFAISEYGAAIWCDPYRWVPEAWRLLRPNGRLVFLSHTALAMACVSIDGAEIGFTLTRPIFGMHKNDWTQVEVEPGGVDFNLPVSDWLRLFRETGFEVEDFLELQAPDEADGSRFDIPAEWAKRYPAEQVWKLRKPDRP